MDMVKKKVTRRTSLGRGLLLAILSFSIFVAFTAWATPTFAAEDCSGPGNTLPAGAPPGTYCCQDPDGLALFCLESVFGNVLKGVLVLVGLLSFLFIIKGGLNYTMAGGDMKAIDAARKTLTWAVIGLGFAIAAFAAMKLLSDTFGANILRFDIPTP